VEEDEVYKFQIFVQVRIIYIRGFQGKKFVLAKEFATVLSDCKEFLVYWRKESGTCNVILI
jgi:hypothetical protein